MIEASGYKSFPPRLPEQPIFYPVLNEEHATKIARDWNAKFNNPAVGYVTRFQIRNEYLAQYEIKIVGGTMHQEYWIPAEDLDAFNQNIVGTIEIIGEFRGPGDK